MARLNRPTVVIAAATLAGTMLGADAPKHSALHPVITEILYNVPPGDAGDAARDGTRDAAGDEFVELFNPHPKAINLQGYTIANRLAAAEPAGKRGVRFTFPKFELPPGGVVVVFNGYKTTIAQPVGTSARAPSGPNKEFSDAFIFTMGTRQPMNAFKNDGDFVLLSSPDGKALQCIIWGEPDPPPPSAVARTETVAEAPKGSVQRLTADGDIQPHPAIDGRAFSPGEMPATAPTP